MTSLEEKIAARSGRIQMIVAAMSSLARVLDSQAAEANLDRACDELIGLAGDYGPQWLDECAMLLKEMYNRRAGP